MLYPYFDGYISDKHRKYILDGFTCLIHDSKLRSFWEMDIISQKSCVVFAWKSCGVFAWIFPVNTSLQMIGVSPLVVQPMLS